MTCEFYYYTNIINDQEYRKQYKLFLRESCNEFYLENLSIPVSEYKININKREALEWMPNSPKFVIEFDFTDICDCEINSITVTDSIAKDIVLFISKFITDNKILSVLRFNTIDAKPYQIELQKTFQNNRYLLTIINQDKVILIYTTISASDLSSLIEGILANIYYGESIDE